jgi:Ras-related protein Rab-21
MAAPLRTKVVLLGDGRVGKTSILLRYVKDVFDDRQASTLTASCFDRSVTLPGGEAVRVSIWDTAGQERFHALGPLYYRDADGALLVYDITDEGSFKRVKDWVAELKKMLGEDIVIAIAGNKADMEKSRTVKAADAAAYVASIGGTHHMTSAKLGTGISDAFTELLKRAWKPVELQLVSCLALGTCRREHPRPQSLDSAPDAQGIVANRTFFSVTRPLLSLSPHLQVLLPGKRPQDPRRGPAPLPGRS